MRTRLKKPPDISQADWDSVDVPEMTVEDFARSRPFKAVFPEQYKVWKRMGRPPAASPKVHISFRLASDVVDGVRATGPGYNARVEKVLRDALVRGELNSQQNQSPPADAERVSEGRSRFDAERTKLGDQLNELEIAERVLTRFGGGADTTERRRRGRPARTAPAGQQAPSVSLSDATLKAVQAHGKGATAEDVRNYLSREFGLTVRPNHLGIALQRHRRAGQLEHRDQHWYPSSAKERAAR
jgi:uncharacterized protein (DUF4415 family)